MQNLINETISCPKCNTINKLPHSAISFVVSCYSCQHRFISIIPPKIKSHQNKLVGYYKRFKGESATSIFAVGLLANQK